jgi:hypothetical protein
MSNKKPYVIFVVFLIIFTVGITWGNVESMLGKAVRICLECIGIG